MPEIDPELRAQMNEAFLQTPLHALLRLRIREPIPEGEPGHEPGTCIVDMPVHPDGFGSSGNLHGGALATLCDVACASAASRASSFRPGENTLVTADLHVRYVGRPRGDSVRCEARVIKSGRQLIVVSGTVLDDEDRVVCSADFAAMVVPLRQPLRPELRKDPNSAEM